MRFRFSAKAEADLVEIADYIAADNPDRAVSFVAELTERCRDLLNFPEAGAPRPGFGDSMRLVPFRRYNILYAIRGDLREIRRIVHAARNLRRL